ncbi:MAG: hypothetical protein FWB83_01660 [Treponema sp.]|nr:hypothetical protein [Treponema sp.]
MIGEAGSLNINSESLNSKKSVKGDTPPVKSQANVSASSPVRGAARPPQSAASLAASAGLPADKISASVVSFARFFSLPLKPQVLADIRKAAFPPQALSQSALQSAQQSTLRAMPHQSAQPVLAGAGQEASLAAIKTAFEKAREAVLLSVAAAESKGVELNQKALDHYTEAVDPRQNSDQRRQKDHNDHGEKTNKKLEKISADNLKKTAGDFLEKDLLLNILNKLPGKNGQRWIVIPFDFSDDGIEYRVSMRILLENDERAAGMALDIYTVDKDQGLDANNRRLFVFESADNRLMRLTVYLQSENQKKNHSQFINDLSQVLEIPVDRISVKISDESFPYEGADQFASVDEAV